MTPSTAREAALGQVARRHLLSCENTLNNIIAIQCSNGNWNANAYMHGMANGLIMAHSLLTGENPDFLHAPDEWLDDRDKFTPEDSSPVMEAHLLLHSGGQVVTVGDKPKG